jgi:hypothetical protein
MTFALILHTIYTLFKPVYYIDYISITCRSVPSLFPNQNFVHERDIEIYTFFNDYYNTDQTKQIQHVCLKL